MAIGSLSDLQDELCPWSFLNRGAGETGQRTHVMVIVAMMDGSAAPPGDPCFQ